MVDITIRKRPRTEAVVTQRKFFKKTARGKVIKVLRERYLRDDVGCGIQNCSSCDNSTADTLPFAGDTQHKSFPDGHFVLPDTNVFLSQMDLMESALFKPPIILLQTVMEEVRHRSIPLYNRLKALVRMDDKRVWVFYNEYRSETAIIREDNESPNDRNDRGIRKATEWYNTHIGLSRPVIRGQPKPKIPTVVLMTEDAANRKKAEESGIAATSIRKYISSLPESYLSESILQAGLSTGKLHKGHFNASTYNYLQGSVSVPGYPKPVLLIGRENLNRAVQGDMVVIEVLDEAKWGVEGDEVVDQEATLKNDDADSDEDEENDDVIRQEAKAVRASEAMAQQKEKQPTGRVVGIVKRNWRPIVCHVDATALPSTGPSSSTSASTLSTQTLLAHPTSTLLPRIRIRTRQGPALVNKKILVAIDAWNSTSRYPDGHFVRVLGDVGGEDAEREGLMLEFGISYGAFGSAILGCLPPEGDSWVVPPKSDDNVYRSAESVPALFLSPPTNLLGADCQDIDDALHARPLPNGNIEAGVHIADVSNFVHADTPMDTEAAARGTTVYLVDKRIDMLPALLGTNLCSLRPNVERLAFSAIWELTPEAEIVNVRFTKSVIRSKAAFTYEEAQLRKDDPNRQDELTTAIRLLNTLAQKLKAARMAAAQSPAIRSTWSRKEMRETNSLVEEFMLLANISVARKIWEAFPATAVLRRHLPPPRTNFDKLKDILQKRKGMTLDVSSSGALADSLDKCIDANEPAFNTLVRIMATRCMLSAEYFCSGSVGRDTFGHYGLASSIYTHFTSPIRRYADVLAHRQLSAAIGYSPLHASLHSKPHVERILEVVNRRHRMAQMAGRASVEYYVGLALKGRGEREGRQVTEEAFVIRTFRNGLGVFVSKLGIEGMVMFKRDITQFDADNYTVTIPGTSTAVPGNDDVMISVFDKVVVNIEVEKDKNTQKGKVKMTLVHPIDSRAL
ncbi:Exosome complex exonuclease dis3 [Mycena venus]|uniref:Ribosomal RNA-processing protein 44 n=1 Tax=Mycena venus TaxID=2733690 RepID=A0A8H7CL47_9AGAR|nr:Exosome complex exonuclease dis3 [Mycena venus]